jgi:hypothetical protein
MVRIILCHPSDIEEELSDANNVVLPVTFTFLKLKVR